jgi:hypothetical protein
MTKHRNASNFPNLLTLLAIASLICYATSPALFFEIWGVVWVFLKTSFDTAAAWLIVNVPIFMNRKF